jgi:nitrate/nitrite-specific signal transduction histidine kinase
LVPSIQTPEFAAMLDQRVQDRTTHLNEKYERLTVDYKKLRRVVMEIRSQISGTCAPVVPKL